MGIVGIILSLLLLYFISFDRKSIDYKSILVLFAIELIALVILLKTSVGKWLLAILSNSLNIINTAANQGIEFVFGGITNEGVASQFFLNVLLPLIFLSALIEILQYTKILPFFLKYLGIAFKKLFRVDESNAFTILGYPFFSNGVLVPFKDQLTTMSTNHVFTLSVYTLSTITVTMIASYVHIIRAEFIIIALVLNAFTSIIVTKIVAPYEIKEDYYEDVDQEENDKPLISRLIDSMRLGFNIAISVAISIIGFVALINFIDIIFNALFSYTLTDIFGYISAPLAFLMGVDTGSVVEAGSVIGTKILTNIFVAIDQIDFTNVPMKTQAIISVFLLSFANLSGLGTTLGLVTGMNKEKGEIVARYAGKLFLVATLVSVINGALVGLFYSFM